MGVTSEREARQPAGELDAVLVWVTAAWEAGRETLAELRCTQLGEPGDRSVPPKQRCEYWVGRLEGALAGLVAAVGGDLTESESVLSCAEPVR